jgi:serine/threonine protein kinase
MTDVWALGALLFVMLTSEEVHRARTSQEQMIYAATQSARPIRSVVADLPERVANVVDTALQFEMQRRWPSASAMRDALAEAARAIRVGLEPVRPRLEIVAEEAPPPASPILPTARPTLILGSVRSDEPKRE